MIVNQHKPYVDLKEIVKSNISFVALVHFNMNTSTFNRV